jgi:ribosomal protein L29
MKMKEVLEKSPADLGTLEKKLREELVMTRLQHAAGRLADTDKLTRIQKDIARVLTAKNQKPAAHKEG